MTMIANNKYEKFDDGYYHLRKDIELYPNAGIYIIYSRRGPGKTYSALWNAYYNKIPIAYMKRTKRDVNFILSAGGKGEDITLDPSPYAPLKRDKKIDIVPYKLDDGIGAFYKADEEGNPHGKPVSYILALNAIKDIKGFEMSEVDWMIMDEFIPLPGEKVSRKEGEMLLSNYLTISRDRLKRGRKPLKLILMANAENISCPIISELEVMDDIAELNCSGERYKYIENRRILLHHITEEEFPIIEKEVDDPLYLAMKDTAWGRVAYGGEFANNDFSAVQKLNVKKMRCMIHLHYRNNDWFIYLHPETGLYYCCTTKNKPLFTYDLNRENGQKAFWLEHGIELRLECIADKFVFQKYSMYDLIVNYKNIFKV